MSLPDPVTAVLDRDHCADLSRSNTCKIHRATSILERPIDCALCAHDVRETLRQALTTNEWLDRWRTDMIHALETLA